MSVSRHLRILVVTAVHTACRALLKGVIVGKSL